MKILGFIPARGGSKTIPLKNLHKIFNKPLIQYTIESALQSKIFYKIIVSSDHNKILNLNKKFKKISSLKRPKNISGDATLHADGCNGARHGIARTRSVLHAAQLRLLSW